MTAAPAAGPADPERRGRPRAGLLAGGSCESILLTCCFLRRIVDNQTLPTDRRGAMSGLRHSCRRIHIHLY
ncbi:MAG: hypothetical protein B7X36_11675 [Thiomonas sp. 14-64-326]|nr:MAG: hypothetical protein B7X36_11675 [Thiomonas sp. 14-64-326]